MTDTRSLVRTGGSVAVGIALFGVAASGTALAHGGGMGGGMHGGVGGGMAAGSGTGFGVFGGGLFLWPLLLLATVAVVGYALLNREGNTDRRGDPALARLRERYANGELTDEEFESRRRTLGR